MKYYAERMMDFFDNIRDFVYDLIPFSGAVRIERGYSFEKKYLLYGACGDQFLLRVSDISEKVSFGDKRAEFEVIKRAGKYSGLVPKAHHFLVLEDEGLCLMVLDYIAGRDCEEALLDLSDDEQYRLGFSAGKDLLKLHGMDAPKIAPEWHERFLNKYLLKCEAYERLGIRARGVDMEKTGSYILDNSCIIKCRRESFYHGDYHPANLIVKNSELTGIVDFNRYGWGDPVFDFVKTAYFTSALSVPFSAGQIDGYNNNRVSSDFWKKYSVYSAMTIVSDLVWSHWYSSVAVSPEQAVLSEKRVAGVFLDHDGFDSDVPRWYREYW